MLTRVERAKPREIVLARLKPELKKALESLAKVRKVSLSRAVEYACQSLVERASRGED